MLGSTRLALGLVSLALVASACGSGDSGDSAEPDAATAPATDVIEPIAPQGGGETQVVVNRGDGSEGHTPTGFEGSGIGLFAGDNLNPSFPDGVGVQLFVSFDFAPVDSVASATLTSDALLVSGDPFSDLGSLIVEPVSYETFGPPLWDLPASGESVACTVEGSASVSCDVTAALADVSGSGLAQFRVRFEIPGDGDGQQDLAAFFITDSNTNEPGIFRLEIQPG